MSASIGSIAPDIELPDHTNTPTRISSLWAARPLVLVFIRHLGCPFCRAHVAEIRAEYSQFEAADCEMAVVAMGDVAAIAAFRKDLSLPFRMLADPEQRAYRVFELPRGGVNAIAGPRVWWAGLKATLKFGGGKVVGDPMQLPGSFVIDQQGIIRLAHHSSNSAEWASNDELLRAVREAHRTSGNVSQEAVSAG